MSNDNYGVYSKPGVASFIACICVAAAIFFGAYAVKMKERLRDVAAVNQENAQKVDEMQAELHALREKLDATQNEASRSVGELKEEISLLHREKLEMKSLLSRKRQIEEAVASIPQVVAKSQMTAKPQVEIVESKVEVTPEPELTIDEVEDATVALKQQVVQDISEAAGGIAGEVLTYNPDANRVYLSLGSANAGLETGKRFTIWRDGQYVADIRVLKVFSVTSTCEVVGPTPKGLHSGDIAKLAGN